MNYTAFYYAICQYKQIKEIKLAAKGKIFTIDEKTTKDTHKKVIKTVWNNKIEKKHLRNTEGRRLGTVCSISTAGDFNPVNSAPNP
jgi:hypothetical protein